MATDIRPIICIMINLSTIPKTFINVLNMRNEWDVKLKTLDIERETLSTASFPSDVYRWTMVTRGELGGFFYDFLPSCNINKKTRSKLVILSAEIQAIIVGADECIDVLTSSPFERETVIQALWNTMFTGKPDKTYTTQEVYSLYPFCLDIYRTICNCPQPELYWHQAELLRYYTMEQIKGNNSIEVSKGIGAYAFGVSSILPACFGLPLENRIIEASHSFGGCLNLLDDLLDIQEDKTQHMTTHLTDIEDIGSATKKTKIEIINCWNSMKTRLTKNELKKFRTLLMLLSVAWGLEIFKDASHFGWR